MVILTNARTLETNINIFLYFYVSMYLLLYNYLNFKFINFYQKKKNESFKVTPNDTM